MFKSRVHYIIITFIVLKFTSFFSQTTSSNGYFAIKINGGYFKDRDGSRFYYANPLYEPSTTKCREGKSIVLDQDFRKPAIFPGAELSYYFARSSYFGFSLGVAYSYDKTYYNYSSYERISSNWSQFQLKIGNGKGSLNNQLYKFTFGFNFNTKFGLNLYFQPANPELRIINNGNSSITTKTYDGIYSKIIPSQSCHPLDSITTLSSTETSKFVYYNYKTGVNFSIAFPTLIGLEQKFFINKVGYIAGISGTFSGLESYYFIRIHLGICLGNFKEDHQPGY